MTTPAEARAALRDVARMEDAGRRAGEAPRWFDLALAVYVWALVALQGLENPTLAIAALILIFLAVMTGMRRRMRALRRKGAGPAMLTVGAVMLVLLTGFVMAAREAGEAYGLPPALLIGLAPGLTTLGAAEVTRRIWRGSGGPGA